MSFFDKLKELLVGAPANANAPPAQEEEPAGRPAPHVPVAAAETATTPGPRRGRPAPSGPRDAQLEERVRALFVRDPAAALALLQKEAVLLACHEQTTLPCLCARCIEPERASAESSGVTYVRDFVVIWGRALFYWTPAELAGRARQVRTSMRAAVRHRLRNPPEPGPRRIKNPFTKEIVVVAPRPRPRGPRINPFTGKVVP
jgi:hypothetical protein